MTLVATFYNDKILLIKKFSNRQERTLLELITYS